MFIKDSQARVDQWVKETNNPYWEPLAILARITEELGELAKAVNLAHGPKKSKGEKANIKEELGDLLFSVICMANSLGIDLDSALALVINKYRERDK